MSRLTTLEELGLLRTSVTDAGLAHLSGLRNLKLLNLGVTGVTDAGLVHLRGLTNLKQLYLNKTGVTNAGLAHLHGMNLKELYLGRTRVTAKGVKRLRSALPNCYIDHSPKISSPLSAFELLFQPRGKGDETGTGKAPVKAGAR